MIRLLLLLLLSPLCAAFAAPSEFKDAREEVYKTVGDTKLKLHIFGESDSAKPKPAIVFFFGGGWTSGTPAQFEKQARHFAERGMIAITADYRVKSHQNAKPVDCVSDAKSAVAWMRANAGRLGIDPQKIAAAGGSAGGHIAACTGTVSGFGSDERPNAMILFNPACTLAAIDGWEPKGFGARVAADRLGADPVAISPCHHIGPHTPPTLILHGKEDTTVPYGSVEAFEKQMKKAGRTCKLVGYEGEGHGFFNRGKAFDSTLAEADRFLVGLGWIR
jgi:acetyl esterase/lipase